MRHLLTTLVLALTLGAAAALPAAAETDTRNWSEYGPRHFYRGEAASPGRRARAYVNHDDDEDVRPRRRRHDAGVRHQRGYSTHRHAARTGHKARRQHIARGQRKGHGKAVAQRKHQAHKPAVAAAKPAPAPTKKSPPTQGSSASGQRGVASYYWQPQRVAAGGWFNPNAMTAAHKTLPFGTRVRVTHLGNGRSVEVRINDRGPYIAGRIIDLSKAAAGVIGMTGQGIARVAVEVLGR